MNPISYFMSLRPVVKIFLICGITGVLITFMYFAYATGNFDIIVNAIFSEAEKLK